MESGPAPSLDDLLSHRDWVRRVACALVNDPGRADDLAQEVWLKAVRRPPHARTAPRGWLATVLRTTAVDQRRAGTREDRRDAAGARPESVPSTADEVAAAEIRRRVVTAVMALREPYRGVILMRYFEGLGPSAAARRTGVPLDTLRSRHRRALALLRARLERELGDDWRAALLPVGGMSMARTRPEAGSGLFQGALQMAIKGKLIAGAAVAVLAGLAWWTLSGDFPGAAPHAPETETAAARAEAAHGVAPNTTRRPRTSANPRAERRPTRGRALERDAGEDAHRGDETAPPTSTDAAQLSGSVLDSHGQPVRGAVVCLLTDDGSGDLATTCTDAEGRFSLPRKGAQDARLEARAKGFRTARAGADEDGTIAFRLEPVRGITGRVFDRATGLALADVPVLARPAGGQFAAAATRTDAEGVFVLEHLGEEPSTIEVGAAHGEAGERIGKYVLQRIESVDGGTRDLRIELEEGREISGRLLDAAGRPVRHPVRLTVLGRTRRGAPDYSRRHFLRVADDGTFRARGLAPGSYDLSFIPDPPADGDAPPNLSNTVVEAVSAGVAGLDVRMNAGALISGTIVDENDRTVTAKGVLYVYPTGTAAGSLGSVIATVKGDGTFRVGPLDPGTSYDVLANTFAGHMQHTVEGLSAGSEGIVLRLKTAGSIRGKVVDEKGRPVPFGTPVRATAIDADLTQVGTGWTAHTQRDGTFVIDGLGDHTFKCRAGGGETGLVSVKEVGDLRVGAQDVVLEVKRGVALTGRLLDARGLPLKTHYLAGHGVVGKGVAWTRVSDEDGRFTLRGLPHGKVRLACYVGEEYVQLGEFDAPGEDVEVTLRD